jgi:hypothetical protein
MGAPLVYALCAAYLVGGDSNPFSNHINNVKEILAALLVRGFL